jgi:polyisoprenoid-binding protein YceI
MIKSRKAQSPIDQQVRELQRRHATADSEIGSSSVEVQIDMMSQIVGELTIGGVAKPVALNVEYPEAWVVPVGEPPFCHHSTLLIARGTDSGRT